MSDQRSTSSEPMEAVDERSVARKYGVRELVYPDKEQLKVLSEYLSHAIDSKRSGPVPKTAVVVMLEFLQATVNRQHITKAPSMSQKEFDLLQTPYYLATRVIAKIARDRASANRSVFDSGKTYQQASASIGTFIDLLRSVLDPASPWLRAKTIPDNVLEAMQLLRTFAVEYPEQRRKGRAL